MSINQAQIAALNNLLANAPDTPELTAFARQVPVPAEWDVLNRILPDVDHPDITWKTSSYNKQLDVAKFRSWDTPNAIGHRHLDEQVREGAIPPLGITSIVGELQTILLALSKGADTGDLITELWDSAEAQALAIRGRMQLAKGQVLSTFQFALPQENGLNGLIGAFPVPTGHTPTAAVYWDDPENSTPLDDERAWNQKIVDDTVSGASANGRLSSTRILNLLAVNDQYRKWFYPDRQLANAPSFLLPGQVNSVRAAFGFPEIEVNEAKVSVDGVITRTTPDNLFIMYQTASQSPTQIRNQLAGNGFGATLWGITASMLVLAGMNNPKIEKRDLPGITTTRAVATNPVNVEINSDATAIPVLGDTNRLLTAKVLATAT